MNTHEYKTLLEKLLTDLETVLKTCTYHSKRTHRISVSQRLEAVKSAGYIVSTIQQVSSQIQALELQIAAEERQKPPEQPHLLLDIVLDMERTEVISILDRRRLMYLLGPEQPTGNSSTSPTSGGMMENELKICTPDPEKIGHPKS